MNELPLIAELTGILAGGVGAAILALVRRPVLAFFTAFAAMGLLIGGLAITLNKLHLTAYQYQDAKSHMLYGLLACGAMICVGGVERSRRSSSQRRDNSPPKP